MTGDPVLILMMMVGIDGMLTMTPIDGSIDDDDETDDGIDIDTVLLIRYRCDGLDQ
jgi:hypothetical protein